MDVIVAALGGTVWTAAFFVLALSVIVFVHEYGHYIIGRLSGIKAEVFSLGFGPRLIARRDRHGTLWQIAAIPLGGYVRFLGDDNAASVKDKPNPSKYALEQIGNARAAVGEPPPLLHPNRQLPLRHRPGRLRPASRCSMPMVSR